MRGAGIGITGQKNTGLRQMLRCPVKIGSYQKGILIERVYGAPNGAALQEM